MKNPLIGELYAADQHATSGPHVECHKLFYRAGRELDNLETEIAKLERCVTYSMAAREHRVRLENELASARHIEESWQHNLAAALERFRSAVNLTPIRDQLCDALPQQPEASKRAPLSPDTASAILRTFDGVRD